MVEASETPTLPDSSHIKEDAYRYRTVLKAFKKAQEDADDNQQFVLLSLLLSVTDYTNDQLNKVISFYTSDEKRQLFSAATNGGKFVRTLFCVGLVELLMANRSSRKRLPGCTMKILLLLFNFLRYLNTYSCLLMGNVITC